MKLLLAALLAVGVVLALATLTRPDAVESAATAAPTALATIAPPAAPTGTYPPGREPMALPPDYRDTFVNYATVDRSDGISRNLYISPGGMAAIAAGQPLPEGTMLIIEAYFSDGPDSAGRLTQDTFDPEVHMAEFRSTWRIEDLAASSHLGGWNFGSFNYDTGDVVAETPLNDCFSCHEGAQRTEFVFSDWMLDSYAQTNEPLYRYCPRPGRLPC